MDISLHSITLVKRERWGFACKGSSKGCGDLSLFHIVRRLEFMTPRRGLDELHQVFSILAAMATPLVGFVFVDIRKRDYQKLES